MPTRKPTDNCLICRRGAKHGIPTVELSRYFAIWTCAKHATLVANRVADLHAIVTNATPVAGHT